MMAVLTAPARIRNPTTTTNALSNSRAQLRPDHVHRQAADQVVAVICFMRTSSGISITARKEICAVSSRL